MSSISLTALILLLVFVTPALVLIVVSRLFFPKTRTIKVSDTVILLISVVANLAVNGSLFSFYFHTIVSLEEAAKAIPKDYLPLLLKVFANSGDKSVIRPSVLFLSDNSSNFFYFIFDLHMRALIIGVLSFSLIKAFGWLEEYLQYIPYKDSFPNSCWDKFILCIFGIKVPYDSNEKIYERKKINISIWGWDILKWFRDAIYHPWAHLTKTNRKREILMVDILTTEGSLYSGAFTTWVPSEESISEITMEYGIRFYPKEEPRLDLATQKFIAKPRKKALIKNNGELIISRERIETVHFWEIRKKSRVTVSVTQPQDIESVKWFLLLAYVFPNYIKSITIHVKTEDKIWADFKVHLGDWIKESRINFDKNFDKIKVEIVRGDIKKAGT